MGNRTLNYQTTNLRENDSLAGGLPSQGPIAFCCWASQDAAGQNTVCLRLIAKQGSPPEVSPVSNRKKTALDVSTCPKTNFGASCNTLRQTRTLAGQLAGIGLSQLAGIGLSQLAGIGLSHLAGMGLSHLARLGLSDEHVLPGIVLG